MVMACVPSGRLPDGGYDYRPPGRDGGGDGGSVFNPICLDNDGDGVPGTGECEDVVVPDCDDSNPAVGPKATERCDGFDNNCNWAVDEGLTRHRFFLDADQDGYGAGAPEESCLDAMPGRVDKDGDCDDADRYVFPGAPEACNSKDDDCNNKVDDNVQTRAFYTDADQDGWGTGAATMSCQASLPGKVPKVGDCDDTAAAINPAATEICNGKDDDCDRSVDESFPNQGTSCVTTEPGICAAGTLQCQSGVARCVRTQSPSAELCDGVDNNCDGRADETFTAKGTSCTAGAGVCARPGQFVCRADKTGTECNASPGPSTAPACDTLDNDCDGTADEVELVAHSEVIGSFNPTALAVAPFYYTSYSCNGGQGSSGTDAFSGYVAAYVVGGDLFVQELRENGVAKGALVDISIFTSNRDVVVAQAGSGMAIVSLYGYSAPTQLDLYYVGAGATPRTVNGTSYRNLVSMPSGSSIASHRLVRGNGGRLVLVWREIDSSGASKIRFARFHLTGSGTAYTLVVDTAAQDLITGAVSGELGAASSHEEYGDSLGCPQGLSRFAVAYRLGDNLLLSVFNEDGTPVGSASTVYYGSTTRLAQSPDLAWTYSGGDRWAAAFSVSWTSSNQQGLYFWQSGGSYSVVGGLQAGASSVQRPALVARPTEFLLSALVTGTTAVEPQARVAKMSLTGSSVLGLTQVTVGAGCSGQGCVNGSKKLLTPLSSAGGSLKTPGVVLFGSSASNVASGVLGCN